MRKWMLILPAVLMALSCSRIQEEETSVSSPEGEVEITFSCYGDGMDTKSLGEVGVINDMHVAIFGGSGYLKDYKKATKVSEGTYDYTFPDASGEGTITKPVPMYTYKFSIALSNSPRRVHFIGNPPPGGIPFGRDSDVLPSLLCEEGATGYWGAVYLDNVTAAIDPDTQEYIRDKDGMYMASNDLKGKFTLVPLIRNWAKIVLEAAPVETSHFEPYSFAVVNVPVAGTVVPYGGVEGFILNYKDLSFDELTGDTYKYDGHLPTSVQFDHTIPSVDDFANCTGGVKAYTTDPITDLTAEAHSVYLYERPVPDKNTEPTYVIVYGRYVNATDASLTDEEKANGVWCYYKVDLMHGSEYYPVLRNFKYTIKIGEISAKGHATPNEAASSAGSADVSADINASSLPDISDGKRRMAVTPWMSHTFIEAQQKTDQLYVVFYDNIEEAGAKPNLDPASVWVSLDPENAGIVKELEILPPDPDKEETDQDYGWRTIRFAIASPEEASARTQTLRISCQTNPGDENEIPLYRDVVISLLPTQPMHVHCSESRVLTVSGESQRIDVDIPDGLVESMFPLYFIIEAQNLTLTPDNTVEGNVLPVISEASIIDNHPTFHFQRTLEWDEYNSLASWLDYEDESMWRTFSSYFKTNCENSATRVYVQNKYFYPDDTSFSNYASFRNPQYTTSIPCEVGAVVDVTAERMSTSQQLDQVDLILKGLAPADGSGIVWDDETGMYKYNPGSGESKMTFHFVTTTDDGDVSVTLRSDAMLYEPYVLTPCHFRDLKVVDMATPTKTDHSGTGENFAHVVYGRVNSDEGSDQVVIGYYTDPDNPRPKTSITAMSGLKTGSTTWNDTGNISSTAVDNYREKWMGTVEGADAVSLTLSAVGYVEATLEPTPRYYGTITSLDLNAANMKTLVTSGMLQSGKFILSLTSADNDHQPSKLDSPNRIVLPAGGHYTLEVEMDSDNRDLYLYYAQIFYRQEEDTVMKPRYVEPLPDGSIYYGYLGNNREYVWSLPFGETGGALTIDAASNRDIVITRILFRAFHGILNDSGNAGGGDIGFSGNGGINDGGGL